MCFSHRIYAFKTLWIVNRSQTFLPKITWLYLCFLLNSFSFFCHWLICFSKGWFLACLLIDANFLFFSFATSVPTQLLVYNHELWFDSCCRQLCLRRVCYVWPAKEGQWEAKAHKSRWSQAVKTFQVHLDQQILGFLCRSACQDASGRFRVKRKNVKVFWSYFLQSHVEICNCCAYWFLCSCVRVRGFPKVWRVLHIHYCLLLYEWNKLKI